MKYTLPICALAILVACTPAPPSSVELCTQTVHDYAVFRDNGPVEAYADLFTETGTFQLGNTITEGREALIARHITANANAAWRHTMEDIRITQKDGELSGISRFIVRTGPRPTPSTVTREIVGHYEDTFELTNGACKIATRKVHITFDTQG